MSISIIPIRNAGAEARRSATNVGTESNKEYCFTADSTPNGTPTHTENTMALNATCRETGARSNTCFSTGCLVI